ncbi:hypothetical protein ACQ1ZK_20095, partial [Enterococcus faecium]
EARAFLQRLRALAAVHPVVALPYGDVGAGGLQSAGLGQVVTRSLPGTPEGTAQARQLSRPDPATGDGATPTTPAETPTTGAGAQ